MPSSNRLVMIPVVRAIVDSAVRVQPNCVDTGTKAMPKDMRVPDDRARMSTAHATTIQPRNIQGCCTIYACTFSRSTIPRF